MIFDNVVLRALLGILVVALAAPVYAATFTVSSTVYQPGTRDVGIPAGVADTDTTVRGSFSRENWPTCEGSPCNVMAGAVYASVNGGPNQQLCAFTAEGGDFFDRHGNLVTESWVECSLPPGIARTVTVVLTNTVQLRTAMTVTTKP